MQNALSTRLNKVLALTLAAVLGLDTYLWLYADVSAETSNPPYAESVVLQAQPQRQGLNTALGEYQRLYEALTVARNREAGLSEQIQDLRLRSEPDFLSLQQRAYDELGAAMIAREQQSDGRYERLRSGVAGWQLNSVELDRLEIASILDGLDIEPARRQQTLDALIERQRNNAEQMALITRAGQAAGLSSYERDYRSDAEILSQFLSSDEIAQYQELQQESKVREAHSDFAAMIIGMTGPMSESARRKLIEGYLSIQDSYIADPAYDDSNHTRQLADLNTLRADLAREVPAQDMLFADIFLESQRLSIDRMAAASAGQ